jgi:hypothetical protein
VTAFARLADGNAKPTRSIFGQNTLFTRTIHAVEYNPITDEIVVPQLYLQGILTFRGGADADEAPIRVISGPATQINGVNMRVGLDPVHEEVFLPLGNEVLVFPSKANGNVAPIRILKGPDTLLGASSIAIDSVHDLLIVTGSRRGGGEGGEGGGGQGQILIFNRTDSGNAKPRAVISGPSTKLIQTELVTVYPPKELILVANHSAGFRYDKNGDTAFVGVWSEHDNGDVPARWTIGGPNGVLRQTRGVAVDPKHKTIIISDKYLNSVLTYSFPEIF